MGGPVEGWGSKVEQALTRGQLGEPYKDELSQTIDVMLGQAKGPLNVARAALMREAIQLIIDRRSGL